MMIIIVKFLACLVFSMLVCGLMLIANTPQYRVIRRDGVYNIEKYGASVPSSYCQQAAYEWTIVGRCDDYESAVREMSKMKHEDCMLARIKDACCA